MSNRKAITARLKDWDGPTFPEEFETLQQSLASADFMAEDIKRAAEAIFGGKAELVCRVKTDDGYEWYWGLQILDENGALRILFPCTRDLEKTDNSQTDRHVALYMKGDMHGYQSFKLLKEFVKIFEALVEKRKAERSVR